MKLCNNCSRQHNGKCKVTEHTRIESDEKGIVFNCSDYRPKDVVKPQIGCSPYYVNISARICELCEAIKRYSTEPDKHDKIRLWVQEILCLIEVDRTLRYAEKRKVFFEEDVWKQ